MKNGAVGYELKIPKYKQIVVSVENSIANGVLKKGDKLPSLNDVKNTHFVSRDTVITAFKELKNRGIVKSIVGKGYYIATEHINLKQKIFVLFDELNSFKEDLYNAFVDSLGKNIQVDIYFHHFDKEVFHKLISDSVGNYSQYVIMPANFGDSNDIISILPKEQVFILDQIHQDLNSYTAIYQNFKKDIYQGLSSAFEYLKKYQKIILLFSETNQPQGIVEGFLQFCKSYHLDFEIIQSIGARALKKGEVYFILDDKNLIRIIKKMKENNFKMIQDIGVISFNDSLLKEVVSDGITTISTDFTFMGKKLAQMILQKEHIKIENPSRLILRQSI